MITAQLLGGACLRDGDAPVGGPPAQRHRIALLALVVAAWPRLLSRDRAMALLWPERDAPDARRLLNLAVHVLRVALGEDALVSTGDALLCDPRRLPCDLHDLRAAAAEEAFERVARLYTGPLLDGFHLADSAEFGFRLDERRRELEHAYVGALRAIAERQEREGDAHGRVGTCRKLVAAALGRVRAHAHAGARRRGRPRGRDPARRRARAAAARGARPRARPRGDRARGRAAPRAGGPPPGGRRA